MKAVREFLYRAGDLVALLCVLPVLLCVRTMTLLGRPQFASGWSQLLCLAPGITGDFLRRAYYRGVLPACGDRSTVSFGTIFTSISSRIGSHVYIGPFCVLGDVTLGDDVLIASHVSIMNGSRQHGVTRLDIPVRQQSGEWPRITIGKDSWIGERAIIMANVGEHCVVGAGAVVTRPVPDFAIVVGSPAKVIGMRDGSDVPANDCDAAPLAFNQA